MVSTTGVSENKSIQDNDLSINEVGIPWAFLLLVSTAVIGVLGVYRWYQMNYSFTVGLDYFEPEFQTYWMSLLYTQLIVVILATLGGLAWLWQTREVDVQAISPQVELQRYFYIFGLLAVVGGVFIFGLQIFTEADAAWHQVTIRDTDFTPTHIALFYFIVPVLVSALVLGTVWLHTRMPDFAGRVSIPMVTIVMGPALIMPNLGFNEWGHTFFYAEELFAAPVHWGFVVLGWAFFAISGLLVQCIARVSKLTSLKPIEA